MPLPDHVIPVAVWAQHFSESGGIGTDFPSVTGEAAIEVREAADSNGVMVASCE